MRRDGDGRAAASCRCRSRRRRQMFAVIGQLHAIRVQLRDAIDVVVGLGELERRDRDACLRGAPGGFTAHPVADRDLPKRPGTGYSSQVDREGPCRRRIAAPQRPRSWRWLDVGRRRLDRRLGCARRAHLARPLPPRRSSAPTWSRWAPPSDTGKALGVVGGLPLVGRPDRQLRAADRVDRRRGRGQRAGQPQQHPPDRSRRRPGRRDPAGARSCCCCICRRGSAGSATWGRSRRRCRAPRATRRSTSTWRAAPSTPCPGTPCGDHAGPVG